MNQLTLEQKREFLASVPRGDKIFRLNGLDEVSHHPVSIPSGVTPHVLCCARWLVQIVVIRIRTEQHSMAWHGIALNTTVQHGTARVQTAQRSTA